VHWKLDHVEWGRPNNAGTLLGATTRSRNAIPVDLRNQRGVPAGVLYGNDGATLEQCNDLETELAFLSERTRWRRTATSVQPRISMSGSDRLRRMPAAHMRPLRSLVHLFTICPPKIWRFQGPSSNSELRPYASTDPVSLLPVNFYILADLLQSEFRRSLLIRSAFGAARAVGAGPLSRAHFFRSQT
jgi:hypothetical protein